MRMSRFSVGVMCVALLCLLGSPFIWRTGARPADDGNGDGFVGQVVSLPGTPSLVGDWTVGTRTVHVSAATKIDQEKGPVVVGAIGAVEGTTRADGSIDAT